MKQTRLYIPVETVVREFDAKMLLACVAAEAGYDVVLGNQKIFMQKLECMPRGIFLDKSATAASVYQVPRRCKVIRRSRIYGKHKRGVYVLENRSHESAGPQVSRQVEIHLGIEHVCTVHVGRADQHRHVFHVKGYRVGQGQGSRIQRRYRVAARGPREL